MIYNYYTGNATPIPTITAILPSDVTVTVGAYSSGYFPLTIGADCQFVINRTGFSPIAMQITTPATVDISSLATSAAVLALQTASVTVSAIGNVDVSNINTLDVFKTTGPVIRRK